MKRVFPIVVAMVLLLLTLPSRAQVLARNPYLQMGTHDSMTIVWRTLLPREGRVIYGSQPNALTESVVNATSKTQHEIRLTSLTPNTRYYYAVGTSTAILAGGDEQHYFVTSPPPGARVPFRLWVVGDSGTGNLNQIAVRDTMLRATSLERRPDLFLHMGDMAYSDGTDLEFQFRFFAIYQDILRNTVTWPTMGNHEGHTSDSDTQSGPYYDAYVLPKSAEAGGLASGTEAYYSFDYANIHFIVLDSHDSPREPDGTMLTWLKSDLQATSADWLIAFWHHPPYTKGSHDSDAEGQLIEMRENALPILEAAGVDLVLAGHSHIYERSYLIDGAYGTPTEATGHLVDSGDGKMAGNGPYTKRAGLNAHDGTVYIVAGHGGASLQKRGNHPVMYFAEREFGSCIIDVDNNVMRLRNIRWDGVISDSFTLVKGSLPSADAGPPDAGVPADAGTPDAGVADAGVADAGTPDAGTPDAGTPDAGSGAGTDAGANPPPDAGTSVPPESGGCGCQSATGNPGFAFLLWLAVIGITVSRRRRH